MRANASMLTARRRVNAALDLVLGAMQGLDADGEAGFALPSHMTVEQLRQLSGQH
jgi:hydrogenase expression/formation protein HypC